MFKVYVIKLIIVSIFKRKVNQAKKVYKLMIILVEMYHLNSKIIIAENNYKQL
jgi:hypothetical protein